MLQIINETAPTDEKFFTYIFEIAFAALFWGFSLFSIIYALFRLKKNRKKPNHDKKITTSLVLFYAIMAVIPFLGMGFFAFFSLKLLLIKIIRLIIYAGFLLWLWKKVYRLMISELSEPSFYYSGAFAVLLIVLLITAGLGLFEGIFHLLNFFL